MLSHWWKARFRERLVRDGIWLAMGHAIVIASGLVSLRLYTELARPDVFGGANLILGALTLGMQSVLSPITQTQLRFHSAYREAGLAELYTRTIGRFASISVLILWILTAVTAFFWRLIADRSEVFVWLCLWILVSAYRAVLINRVQAERRQLRYAAWVATEAILAMLLTASALLIWPSVAGYVAGQVAAIGLAVLCFSYRAFSDSDPKQGQPSDVRETNRSARRQIIDYGLPFFPFALLGWLSNLADRYVLASVLDAAAVGQYVAAFGIASRLPSLIGALMTDIFRPALFEAQNAGDTRRANRLLAVWLVALALLILALLAALSAFGHLIIALLLAPSYQAGAKIVIVWIAAGYGFAVFSQVLENYLLSLGRSRLLLWTKIFGAVPNLGMAITFIPMFGTLGAAYANALGQFTMLVATTIVVALIVVGRRQSGNSKKGLFD